MQVGCSPRCCLVSALSVSPARALAAPHLVRRQTLEAPTPSHLADGDSLLPGDPLRYSQELSRKITCVRMVDSLKALEAPAASSVCLFGMMISISRQARNIDDIFNGFLSNLQPCAWFSNRCKQFASEAFTFTGMNLAGRCVAVVGLTSGSARATAAAVRSTIDAAAGAAPRAARLAGSTCAVAYEAVVPPCRHSSFDLCARHAGSTR